MAGLSILSRWLLVGEWRAQPLRAFLAVVAIAVGVAMGFAIHLVNAAAFNEFSAAARSLSGETDLQVASAEPVFDESFYPLLAARDGVAGASPVIEVRASVPGREQGLRLVGVDALRAAEVSPALVGISARGKLLDAVADDTVFLSAASMTWLGLQEGDTLVLRSGTATVQLRVAGSLPQARAGQRLAVMDIAALQWRFGQLGRLSRIDLKLAPGVDRQAFARALAGELERRAPGLLQVTEPGSDAQAGRTASMSRAYRVNLAVLALVALFTGAFLVFSTQALSVVRRRGQFALLRVLGMERGALLRQVLAEGAGMGAAGAALGIALGYALAAAVLHFFGGDLGGGYFPGVRPRVHFAPVAAVVFFALGTTVAVLGCLVPAWDASRAAPAPALKSSGGDAGTRRLVRAWPALVLVGIALLLLLLPPVDGLPLFAYVAIALLLVGAIALMPRLAAVTFRALERVALRRHRHPPVLALSLARLANASGQASIALGGVLASFSLMVAMAIMVDSFRVSVDEWLVQVLPADLYISSAPGGETAAFGPGQQAAIAALPGVARADFLRLRQMSLDPARPPVALLARTIDAQDPGRIMPLVGEPLAVPAGMRPAWVSEAMLDLYGVKPGGALILPLGGQPHPFFVAGVWRDYARQFGAVQVRSTDYRALTGDALASDAAVWVAPGTGTAQVREAIRALPFGAGLRFSEPGEIREISLAIFDRSFAITYLLEAIAVGIGMAGVAATFSAQALSRSREFGMLRHVGVTRAQVLGILALEGGALAALGVACGFALGFAISLVLVFIVNPQSFHWTMQLHLPWPLLASVAAALLLASVGTALVAGRYALSPGPVRAVREDW